MCVVEFNSLLDKKHYAHPLFKISYYDAVIMLHSTFWKSFRRKAVVIMKCMAFFKVFVGEAIVVGNLKPVTSYL